MMATPKHHVTLEQVGDKVYVERQLGRTTQNFDGTGLLDQLTHATRVPLLVPPGVIDVIRGPRGISVVVEQPPEVRTVALRVGDNGHLCETDVDENGDEYCYLCESQYDTHHGDNPDWKVVDLALPWVYFVFRFDYIGEPRVVWRKAWAGTLSHVFVSGSAVTSRTDPVQALPLPNVGSDGGLCHGSAELSEAFNTLDNVAGFINSAIDTFWSSGFNQDIVSHKMAQTWNHLQSYDHWRDTYDTVSICELPWGEDVKCRNTIGYVATLVSGAQPSVGHLLGVITSSCTDAQVLRSTPRLP